MVWDGRGGARECNTQLCNASVVAQGWAYQASAWARVPHIHMNMRKGCALCALHCGVLCCATLCSSHTHSRVTRLQHGVQPLAV